MIIQISMRNCAFQPAYEFDSSQIHVAVLVSHVFWSSLRPIDILILETINFRPALCYLNKSYMYFVQVYNKSFFNTTDGLSPQMNRKILCIERMVDTSYGMRK